ncbi:N-acetylneuraminate synthase family protein [Halorientalis halophila]|uniref:N-acetylneuraminate synthase family protein n=1 Tax=Halorientalis halophila TaxID=3108499 RepID=UPI00300B9E99
MTTLDINGLTIGGDARPYIIAEAGTNFRGDVTLGKRFIEEAAKAGADAVKFQTHIRDAEMSEPGMQELGFGDLYERLREQELSLDEHRELQAHCADNGVDFLSTPFSVEGVSRLAELEPPAVKIGSGELTNYHLLDAAAATGKPLLISTGMSDSDEVRDACSFVADRTDQFALFYCVSAYPTATSDLNLDQIEEMQSEFGVPVGFSDHSTGIEAAAVAMARGADIVEKHFTIDRRLPGGDQEVSIEPDELAALVDYADLVDETRGLDEGLLPEERSIKEWANHSVVATERIEEGDELTERNVTTKRPGTGIPASEFFDVLGKTVIRDIEPDTVLQPDDLRRE